MKCEDNPDHAPVLVGDVGVILVLDVRLDLGEDRFEFEGAAHQVEQERQQEVADVVAKQSELLHTVVVCVNAHRCAVNQCRREVCRHQSRKVHERCLGRRPAPVCEVIVKINAVVHSVDQVIDTSLRSLEERVEFESE